MELFSIYQPQNPLEKGMATHSSILAWRIHVQRSLVGYSPWGCKKSDTTNRLTLSLFNLRGTMNLPLKALRL